MKFELARVAAEMVDILRQKRPGDERQDQAERMMIACCMIALLGRFDGGDEREFEGLVISSVRLYRKAVLELDRKIKQGRH